MTRYLISFDEGTMVIPDDELPAVSDAAHAVVRDAKAAGVWVTGGGLVGAAASIVAVDGTVVDGPYPHAKAVVGGFSIVDVETRDEALAWAARIAESCRCPQDVREIMHDPEV